MSKIINKWHLAFLLIFNILLLTQAFGQTVVDSIIRPGLAPAGLAVYEKGNKLCVFDDRTNHLLIYDCATLTLKKEIIFRNSISDPFSCIGMAVNEKEGKLYACLGHENWPEKWVMIAIVDLVGDSLLTEIPIPGLLPQSANGFVYDPDINKIFLVGWQNNVFIVDLNKNAVTTIKINATHLSLNQLDHEVFLAIGTEIWILNHITHQFSFVCKLGGTQVYDMTISSTENKIYLITVAPFTKWIYDRDDGSVKKLDDSNDSMSLFFSPGANMVYTSAEIACRSTVIDCKTDKWYYLPMMGGAPKMGFRYATKHAYFVHSNFIGVYDEISHMFEKIEFNNPHSSRTGDNQLIAVNQTTGRVYVSHVQIYYSPDYNPIWVIQDTELMTRPNVILHDISAKFYTYFSDTKYEILDPASNEAVEYWESSGSSLRNYPAQGITFRPDGGRIYCVTHSLENSSGELEVHAGSGAWDKTGKSAGNFNALIGSLNLDSHKPKSVVTSPDGSKVYIPCSATNKIITVDVTVDSSLVITNESNVGNSPWGCAITPDGTKLYVTNKGSNNVSVVNTLSKSVVATIPVGSAPWGIAINPSGTLAYVANSGSNNISVINLSTDSVIETVTTGSLPYWLIFTPDGKYVFVTNNGSGTVTMIDAGTHGVINSILVGSHPEGICVYPDGTKVYVGTDSTAWIINVSDLSVSSINNSTVGRSKKNIVAVANQTSRLAGRVQNGNHQPVANAVIKVSREGIEKGTAITNASGDYSIFNLNKGTYDIEVTSPNYNPQSLASQSVGTGRIKTCYFNLIPFLPGAAGKIAGTSSVCQAESAIIYSVPDIPNATSYKWTYSGKGATLKNDTTKSIYIIFAANSTSGNLTVMGKNSSGYGTVSEDFPITVIPIINTTENKSICQGQNHQGWTSSGTYKRTLQSKAGCDSIVTTILTVNPVYNIVENKSICNGQSFNGWTTSGTYKRTLQSKAGCDSIVTTNLTVNTAFQPAISHQRDTLKSTDAYQSYQWFDDKGKISGATSKQYVIGKSGKYHLEITDNNGCNQTSAELSLIYTNAIILNLPEFKYSVIPNPNTGKFTFRVDSKPQGKINLHLVNPLGQTVEKRELRHADKNHVEQFNISHLSKGMYHLIIQTDNGQKSEKIMVQ